jgi:hypothetical protein
MIHIDLWNPVVNYWSQCGISIRSGATTRKVEEFQLRNGVILPKDVLEYLQTVDGSGHDEMDDAYYRFWPLSEIRPVHEVLDDSRGVVYPDRFSYPDCFVFADHLLDSWLYAVKLTGDPDQPAPVYRVLAKDVPGERMSCSFREFMICYANDPKSTW